MARSKEKAAAAEGDTGGARRICSQVKVGAPPRSWKGRKGKKHGVGAVRWWVNEKPGARPRIQLCHFTPHRVFFSPAPPSLFPSALLRTFLSLFSCEGYPVCGNSQQKPTHASDVGGETTRGGSRSAPATGASVTLTLRESRGPESRGQAQLHPPVGWGREPASKKKKKTKKEAAN